MNQGAEFLSVLIPVYNNQDSLKELINRITKSLTNSNFSYELIFVNDGSKDQSLSCLRSASNTDKSVKVISLSRNFGQHSAISAALQRATGSLIILMDADLQDRPEDIPVLLNKIMIDKVDIVYTIKNIEGPRAVKLTSALYHYIFSKVVGAKIPLNIGTFRIFNKRVLDAMLLYTEVNAIYGPLMHSIGFNYSFLNLPYIKRPYGRSAYNFFKRLTLALDSLISYTDIPHRVTMAFGIGVLLLSAGYSVLILIQYLISGTSLPSGSTMIILILFLSLGSIMIVLGILGSYIYRIFQEVLRRPRFLIQEEINFNTK